MAERKQALGPNVASAGRGGYSLWTHLVALGLVISLPIIALAGVLLYRAAVLDRQQAEAQLQQLAADLVADVDRYAELHFTVLNTLAMLKSVDNADWPSFYADAKAALRGDGYIVMVDRSLRQLANTYVPYGRQPEKTGDPETVLRLLESGRPEVSNRFMSLVTRVPSFNFDVPVVRDGEIRYILCYGRKVEELRAILADRQLVAGWSSTLRDRNGALLASTNPVALEADTSVVGGSGLPRVQQIEDAAGRAILRADSRAPLSGWLISVEVPLAIAQGPLRRNVQYWGVLGAAAVAFTIALGLAYARFIERQIAEVARAASAIIREQPIPAQRLSLKEAQIAVDAFRSAGAELAQRVHRERLLSRELNHRVKNILTVVQGIVRRTVTDQRSAAASRGILERRLSALARANDLLTKTEAGGAPIRDILNAELEVFEDLVTFSGPDIVIRGREVQNLAMVVHELTTNAVKYGALSRETGAVAISWQAVDAKGACRLSFRWEEKNGPLVVPPATAGFGATLLQSAFPFTTRLDFRPEGLVFEFEADLVGVEPLAAIAGDFENAPTDSEAPTERVA